MTEQQTEQSQEQPTNEAKMLADMSLEELQKENERLDAELDKPVQQPSSFATTDRKPFIDARSGEELTREVQATRRDLLREFEALEQDERYSEEHKIEQMW